MFKIQNIIEGWRNDLKKDPFVEKIAKERAKECALCPEATYEKFFFWIKGDEIADKGFVCRVCGCPLRKKLRSLGESCPKNKWKCATKP